MTTADYLSRLAIALPFVLLLLAGSYQAVRRGWIRLPGAAGGGPAPLRLVATIGLGPGSRLVVVDFGGDRLLLATSRGATTVIATCGDRP